MPYCISHGTQRWTVVLTEGHTPQFKLLANIFFLPISFGVFFLWSFSWILTMVRVGAYWKNLLSALPMKGQSSITIMPRSTWLLRNMLKDLLLNLPLNLTLVIRMDVQPSRHQFPIMPVKRNNVVSRRKGWICCKISNGMGELIPYRTTSPITVKNLTIFVNALST